MVNVLVLGSGGREHAIVWKLRESKVINNIYCIPGNAGILELAKTEQIKLTDVNRIYQFILSKNINLVIIGPEQPLVEGFSDYLINRKIKVFGVTKKQSQLEGSKIFAKEFMVRHGIPTSEYRIADDISKAKFYVEEMFKNSPKGIVIKADGLASGKGVIVCDNEKDAIEAIIDMIKNKTFGSAGEKVLIEKKIDGTEISVIAFCDGETIIPLKHSQDHKRVYDNDMGLNTGGMGAFAPVPFVSEMLEKKIYEQIMKRFLSGIQNDSLGYNGIIYFGLMIENLGQNNEQPYVLEFNCRFGDPETQVILPLVENDLYEIVSATLEKSLYKVNLKFKDKFAVCVVLASKGYPKEYETGKIIYGLEEAKSMNDVIIFHSGTKFIDNNFYTSGGRVLAVTSLANSLGEAIKKSYLAVEKIDFEGKHFRKDIGKKGLITN